MGGNLMESRLAVNGYIPLDKSWIIRMGVLDLMAGYDEITSFLDGVNGELSGDLKALKRVIPQWEAHEELDVGESGTLYRFLKLASWKLGREDRFKTSGTLDCREISDDKSFLDLSLEELLKKDNGTSQWASAAVLLGDARRVQEAPFKLLVTYDALDHWKKAREEGRCWSPRYDQTIFSQAEAYLQWLRYGRMEFTANQAEDYCFAKAFGKTTLEYAMARWKSLKGHESNRLAEMETEPYKDVICSRDHRVVQAIAMLRRKNVEFLFPECVKKIWPQFWQFWYDAP